MSPATDSARPFAMPFAPGQVINEKYEVVDLVGVGGLGFVIAALHLELGEKVALKFLRPEALANAEAVGRFAREARASAKIQSEHVARVFDVGTLPDGAPFIVMEYLEGADLAVLLHQRGPMPVPLAIDYVLQTCEALAAAHARGVVHRDIKPDNLFLNRAAPGVEVIKVLDFGISKLPLARTAFEARHPLAETSSAMGSPIYMSPEQIRASKSIDARTDIWSLGCVLYELLTNHLAFEAPSVTEVTAQILESPGPSLSSTHPEVPAELEHIIQRCLAKQPDQRYQSVAQLAVALAPFASPRGRMAIDRCCTILQNAGVARAGSGLATEAGATAPELLSLDASMAAASTAALETPPRSSHTPTARKWPWSIAALIATSSAAGLFVSLRMASDAADTAQPIEAPEAVSAAAPATDVAAPSPPEPPQNSAPAAPREEEVQPGGTLNGGGSVPVAPGVPGGESLPEAAAGLDRDDGAAAAVPEAAVVPERVQDTAAEPGQDGSPRGAVTKAKPVVSAAPSPRRRAGSGVARARAAAPSRAAVQQEEPDVGF